MMSRTSRELAVAHRAHFPAQGLLAGRNTKRLPQPLGQIAKTPANNAVEVGCGATLDRLCQCRTLVVIEQRRLAGALPLIRPSGPRALNRTTQSRTIWTVTLPSLPPWSASWDTLAVTLVLTSWH